MKNADLVQLREGRTPFARFCAAHRDYFERMSRRFYRPLFSIQAPLDVDDLEQLARLELWEAVHAYEFYCPACARSAKTAEVLARHTLRRHGAPLQPRGDLFTYVHNRVGRRLDHEVRRHVRRVKFQADLHYSTRMTTKVARRAIQAEREEAFQPEDVFLKTAPNQVGAVELGELVREARIRLGPRADAVLESLALDAPVADARDREERRSLRAALRAL